jgi:hypothetical protein
LTGRTKTEKESESVINVSSLALGSLRSQNERAMVAVSNAVKQRSCEIFFTTRALTLVPTSQIGTNVRARVFNAGLLARSQSASGRSCDRPTRSKFSVVFLGPRATAELVSKFHVALHAFHVARQMLIFQNFALM